MKGREGTEAGLGGGRRARQAWPAELRLQLAQAMVDRGVAAATLSKALGVSQNTLHDWALRYRRGGADGVLGTPGTGPAERMTRGKGSREAGPRGAVVSARRVHPEHGTRRIRDELGRYEGVKVSEPTVRRILHEEGLMEGQRRVVAKVQPEPCMFERAEPNQLWQSDIFTFLLRRHERLYVAAFLDDYSRYVVSLVMAHHQRSSLVMEALARGIAEYGAPREVLTDQGRQYVSWRGQTEFAEELRRQGIQHLKSRPHHPETLGKIERFWKTLWEEFLSRTVFADYGDCERRIKLFVQAYNFRRPHQGIGGLVPADRFFRAAPQVREAIERGIAPNALALSKRQPARLPFYLVGRLGDQDLSIALTGSGVFVKLGEREQTITAWREESGEETGTAGTEKEEPAASDTEVALERGGHGSGGQGSVFDGAERSFGGDAGDGCDHHGGSVAGDLLPAGTSSPERDAEGAHAGSEGGGRGLEAGAADPPAGVQGQEAGTGSTALGAAPGADAEGGAGTGGELGANVLDASWSESFQELPEDGGGEAEFEPDAGWRGRAVSWDRKLAGAEAALDVEELHPSTPNERGEPAAVSGGGGGLERGDDSLEGGPEPGSFAEPLPGSDEPGPKGVGGGALAPARGASCGPGSGAAASEGERSSAAGERPFEETSGDDGPGAGAIAGLSEKEGGERGQG
jgi:transposase InsO family protein